MSSDDTIRLSDLPEPIREAEQTASIRIQIGTPLAEAERSIIMETLAAYNGNKSKTADILGIGRKTLHRKLDEFAADCAAESGNDHTEGVHAGAADAQAGGSDSGTATATTEKEAQH